MLYIIAGLVVILLIAVLVMRKNKAQKPSEQSAVQNAKTESLSTPATSKSTPTQTATNHEKKFDHIDIAQRFMDQQRYDKAIETLNRGLIEKPNDSQMSLKLLAVYATIDESDSFNKVYDAIKANNDEQSIAQADELKALLTAEQEQVAKQALPADNSQRIESQSLSLDFDLPTDKAAYNSPVVDTAAENVEYKNDLSESTYQPNAANNFDNSQLDIDNFEDIEQAFDLSLSDLEDSANESAYMADVNAAPVTTLDLADDNTLVSAASVIENDIVIDSNNIDADFDFDWSEKSPISSEYPVELTTQDNVNNQSNELTLDDDFVLDLDDSHIDTDSTINNEANSADIAYDSLTLSLDRNDVAHETLNQPETQPSSAVDNFDDFSFEDISIEDANIEDLSIEETGIIKNEFEASSIAPTTLMFDDNTPIDDDFDFDNLSEAVMSSTPVASKQSDHIDNAIAPVAEITSAEDFSSQFAADFDFVKTLDSNQVTLDLAGQYLQLGEYDSAKRLLNEVIAQGNSEQQQQAQQLLERTA